MSPFGEDVQDVLGGESLEINSNMWMIVRFIIILRGLFSSLELDISAVNIWRKYAAKILDNLILGDENEAEEEGDVEDMTGNNTDNVDEKQTLQELKLLRKFSKWLKVRCVLS